MKLDTRGCSLVKWRGEQGFCNWCDKELTGRQIRWCSSTCADAYGTQHWWGYASKEAKKRDGHRCTRCGHSSHPFLEAAPELDNSARPQWGDFERDAVGHLIGFTEALQEWRRPHDEWSKRKSQHEIRNRLEVHHITAAEGKHSRASCIHHLDNLVTLCHACHLEAEKEKRYQAKNLDKQTVLL